MTSTHALEHPNHPSEPGTDPWSALKAPTWRGFHFETGFFLLHVPSSHVFEAPEELVRYVQGLRTSSDAESTPSDADLARELDALAAGLPMPAPVTVQPDIQAISLNLAQGCNLRCTYCFAGDGDYGVKGMMSFETAKAALTLFSRGRSRLHVVFFGGEPMLNFSVIQQIVAWCETQACRFTFAITTNGTLLTQEKLAWFKEKNIAMTLSYDGHGLQSRQRLTQNRRANSEALVRRKIEAFAEQLGALRDMMIRTTVTKENLEHLEEAMLSTLTAHNFKLAVIHHTTPFKALAFGEKDVEQLVTVLRRVVDRLIEDRDWDKLRRLDNIMKHVRSIHRGRTGLRACGAGLNYLTVSVSGDFYLCHRFNEDPSERFGGIADGLDEERMAEVARFRTASADPCKSCWVRQWCAGGCMHEHKSASGDKFRPDPMYCKLLSQEIEQAMRVYTVLLKQAPQILDP